MNESTEISLQELKESSYKFELNVKDIPPEEFDRIAKNHPFPLLVHQDESYVESQNSDKLFLNDKVGPCLVIYVNIKGKKPLYLSGHYSTKRYPFFTDTSDQTLEGIVRSLKLQNRINKYKEFVYRLKYLTKDYGADNVELYLFGENFSDSLPLDAADIRQQKEVVTYSLGAKELIMRDFLDVGIQKDHINDQRKVWSDKRSQTMFDPRSRVIYHARR